MSATPSTAERPPQAPWISRVLPPVALSVALSGVAMGLAGTVPAAAGPWLAAVLAPLAAGAVARLAGRLAGFLAGLLCVAWLAVGPQPAFDAPLSQRVAVALAVGLVCALAAWWAGRRFKGAILPAEPAVSAPERGLLLLLLLATVLPFVLYAALGSYVVASTRAETALRLERVVRAAQEHASKVLETNEMLLGRLIDLAGSRSDEEVRRDEPVLHARLLAMTAQLEQLQSIWVENAAGRPILTNRFLPAPTDRLDVSDRDFFVWHREGRGGFFISQPAIGRVTGEPFFDTSVRRERPGGGFAGVVHASLRPEYFTRFYADLAQDEPGLAIKLVRLDGVLLARHPPAPGGQLHTDTGTELMARLAAGDRRGLLSMQSSFDGRMRLLAFQRLDPYELYVGAGVDEQVIEAAWKRNLALLAALLFPVTGGLVAAAWLALQRARREHGALAMLRAEVEQRRRAEEVLLKTQKLQALALITGSVAHDFNNLLAVVSNSAHVIQLLPPGSDVRPQAQSIERAVRNGAHLTRQLLAFSRRQALRPEDLDLAESLPRTLEFLRTSVSGRVRVDLDIEPGLWPVRIDPAELELALLNLVLNARDAMAKGGRVQLRARNASDAEGRPWVRLSVSDQGPGIAPALLERVFEPFFTTKGDTHGTGLGLNQVRAACEQAGGSVVIESAPGHGTTVTLSLPGLPGAALPRRASGGGRVLEGSILIVEDDAEVARTTASLLEAMGARCQHADGAAAALARLADAQAGVDCVLTDVAMSGEMNGLALARRLRQTHPDLPVVLMTGFADEIAQAAAENFIVLAKPCDPDGLARALAEARERTVAPRPAVA